ncbi:AraC family transcriptional regulator [Pedobacter sp. MC2016-14]|uniref:AraC family transcriptional regulator n=1 Tax=Pedobacter sp. MC2016-14 TaxID=2897327 RepID=UPI001E41C082|nr:AraC family transcriptional regulator [Pedobacter sp. MC2016-14]MCD0489491.1 AraC family transcriptional regulator [Pedobacter sp. MC2016-14]
MANVDKEVQISYISSVNKALKFIDGNLDTNLSLETIAKVACFSPYHFHRIFKAITNETLNSYINRKRTEKVASILIRKPEVSITELSLLFGFTSNSSLTRAFKKYYSSSPSEFRKQKNSRFSKISKIESKNGQGHVVFEEYICSMDNLKNWIEMNAKIEIKEITKLELAYVKSIGAQGITAAYDTLVKWATPQGLLQNPETKMVTIYHDSFKTTNPEKVRISACITLTEPLKVSGNIGRTSIEKGKFIVGSFVIGLIEFEKSWNSLFVWMAEHGYKKADREPFEIYHNDYRTHPDKKCFVDYFIPIL